MALADLTDLERRVRAALLDGREADAAVLAPGAGLHPPVRGELLAELLRSDSIDGGPGPRRIALRGFAVDGTVDLASVAAIRPFALAGCQAGTLTFREGKARGIALTDCVVDDLILTEAEVQGSVRLIRGTTSGRIDLLDAHVTGSLNFEGHQVSGRDGLAIVGDRLAVDRATLLRHGFTAHGDIRLRGAEIGGELSCDGAHLRGLDLDGAAVHGPLFFRAATTRPFVAEGEVRLTGAQVRGPVEVGGTLSGNPALRAGGIKVDTALVLQSDLSARGRVAMKGACVEGDLSCRAAALHNGGGVALDLTGAHVKGTLRVAPSSVDGRVVLKNASAGRFEDYPARRAVDLDLDGLIYNSIGACEGEEPPARKRVEWLPKRYGPQPYEALAAAYRRDGREDDARLVDISKQRHRTRSLSWWRRPWGWMLDILVGYGYVPARALLLLGLLLIGGTLVFADLHDAGALQARGGDGPKPAFSPVFYTLDLLLPVVSLRQRDAWVLVDLAAQVWAAVFIVVGWAIATAVAAALAGLVRRR